MDLAKSHADRFCPILAIPAVSGVLRVHAIRPYLEHELRSKTDECMAQFGGTSRQLCLDSSQRKERIHDLISRIDSHERCSNEKMAGSWGY
jgi:hypothetical protein